MKPIGSRTTRWLAHALFAPGLAVATMAGAEPVLEVGASQVEALGIEVDRVEAAVAVARALLPGRVLIPNDRMVVLSTRTAGVVTSLAVAIGDAVETGQPVGWLESPGFLVLQREYLEALSRLALARSTFERERQLVEEGIIASRRAAESEAGLREARSLVEQRRQALAIVGLDAADLEELARARALQPALAIRATVPGFVLEQLAHVGERLAGGAPVYRIGQLDELHVEIHVPLAIARALHVGDRFRLADEEAGGRVIAVGRDVHALDQGVAVRGAIERGGDSLRPGQFVRVELESGGGTGQAFEVPTTAIARVAGSAYVFRAAPGGFEPLAVEVVGGSGSRVSIAGAISPGDALVIRGTAALKAHWLARGGPD